MTANKRNSTMISRLIDFVFGFEQSNIEIDDKESLLTDAANKDSVCFPLWFLFGIFETFRPSRNPVYYKQLIYYI